MKKSIRSRKILLCILLVGSLLLTACSINLTTNNSSAVEISSSITEPIDNSEKVDTESSTSLDSEASETSSRVIEKHTFDINDVTWVMFGDYYLPIPNSWKHKKPYYYPVQGRTTYIFYIQKSNDEYTYSQISAVKESFLQGLMNDSDPDDPGITYETTLNNVPMTKFEYVTNISDLKMEFRAYLVEIPSAKSYIMAMFGEPYGADYTYFADFEDIMAHISETNPTVPQSETESSQESVVEEESTVEDSTENASEETSVQEGSESVLEESSSYENDNSLEEESTDTSTGSTSQNQALASAKSYIAYSSFSYTGLVKQLEWEGYSHDDAVWAADHCGADWYAEALESAKSYINSMAFSYTGLIEQLEYEGFSSDEATYGADNCGADWDNEALQSAQSYINSLAFSYSGLVDQLEYEGFTSDQAVYGADNCGADWNAEAAESAADYLSWGSFSRDELIDQLLYEGFTSEQAEYGVSQNGL